MSRWQDIQTTLVHMARSANQDAPAFKFAAATVSSLMLVASRCVISSQSASQAQGSPQEKYAQTAAAQTVFREWGAFLTSYGMVNTVNVVLGQLSQKVFNLRAESVGKLGLGQGLGQLAGIALGKVRQLPAAPQILTGETRLHVGPGGIRGQGFLRAVAQTLAKEQSAGLGPEAVAKLGFTQWMNFGPTLAGTAIGVAISGWMLERLALIKGPQLVAFMMKPEKASSQTTPAEVAATHPPLQLAAPQPVVMTSLRIPTIASRPTYPGMFRV